jgi:hypothetical protein
VNTVLLAALLDAALLSPVVAAVLQAFIVPVITFLASRLWGFERAN